MKIMRIGVKIVIKLWYIAIIIDFTNLNTSCPNKLLAKYTDDYFEPITQSKQVSKIEFLNK